MQKDEIISPGFHVSQATAHPSAVPATSLMIYFLYHPFKSEIHVHFV